MSSGATINKKLKSNSGRVLAKVLPGTLQALRGSGGSLDRLEVRKWLEENVEFTEWESSSTAKSKHPRWWVFCNWNTVDLIKAGYMTKDRGLWHITERGEKALDELDPVEIYKTAKKAYKDWYRSRDDNETTAHEPAAYQGQVCNFGDLPRSIYNTQTATIQQLISQVDQGSLALPDIQRPFVWKNKKVRDLLDSMFRGFPIGYILTWRNPLDTHTRSIGTDNKGMTMPHSLVIDGQQRLTSLYAVLTGKSVLDLDFKKRKIQIAFHPISGTFEVADVAIKKNPEWISDVSLVFTDSRGSMSVAQEFLDNLTEAREIEDKHRLAAEQNILRLVDLQNMQLSVLEIEQDAEEEYVAEIFVRINSRGQNLKQSDFILTLLAVFWPEGRRQLEEFSRDCKIPSEGSEANPFNHILKPGPEELIRSVIAVSHRRARLSSAYQVLRGKDQQTGTVTEERRNENLQILAAAQNEVLSTSNWHEFIKTLESVGYRRRQMLQSMNAVMMSYSFFIIGRREFGLSVEELRTLIGSWFSFVTITGRYSGSAESAMEEDLVRIRKLDTGDGEGFKSVLQNAISVELTSEFWELALPMHLESSNTRTIYPFFAAQVVLSAKALYSTLEVSTLLSPDRKSTRKDLEIHHLFPKAWLKRNGITSRQDYNQIANQTLVEWHDNADIGDTSPATYAPNYDKKMTNESRDTTLELHAMPNEWWNLPYDEFIYERRLLMADIMQQAFESISSV